MEYNNILNVNNFFKSHQELYIDINSNSKSFTWYDLLLKDNELEDFNTSINCFIETPLSLIKSYDKSIYNNQCYLSLEKPNMYCKDNENFYKMLDKINKTVLDQIEKHISICNDKNNNNLIFGKFQNPYSLEDNKIIKLYIDKCQGNPLFYNSKLEIIPKNLVYTSDFMKKLINRKIKCIFKPMIWLKRHNDTLLSGIKYFISQCILSDTVNINVKDIFNKKLLSFDNEISECSICHNSLTNIEGNNYDTAVTELSCKHKFHFKCINTWWMTQSRNNQNLSCPFCRNL
jgi:hypothetical protein